MEVFAGYFLDGAARYNASKHGLAIQANEQNLRLGNEEIPEIMSAGGPALTSLEIRQTNKDRETWHRSHCMDRYRLSTHSDPDRGAPDRGSLGSKTSSGNT
jgi:hypothetical protein